MELNELRKIRVDLSKITPSTIVKKELKDLRKIKVQLSGAKPMVDTEGGEFDMLNGSFADYPWEQCIADQTKAYGSKDIAERVCGAIKAQNS